jgi:hypothetical protein
MQNQQRARTTEQEEASTGIPPCPYSDVIVARTHRAVFEIIMPLRPHAAKQVFTSISETVLSELASSLERAAMGTRFSESGALCLEAHVTGTSLFAKHSCRIRKK